MHLKNFVTKILLEICEGITLVKSKVANHARIDSKPQRIVIIVK